MKGEKKMEKYVVNMYVHGVPVLYGYNFRSEWAATMTARKLSEMFKVSTDVIDRTTGEVVFTLGPVVGPARAKNYPKKI